MQGRILRGLGALGMAALVLLPAGCMDQAIPAAQDADSSKVVLCAGKFDPKTTGTIKGRVTWQGEAPLVPSFSVPYNLSFVPPWPKQQREKPFANPNAPLLGPAGEVANAVVFLRRVDPSRSRLWDHGAVTVYFRDYEIRVRQDHKHCRTGFVRCGDTVEFGSQEQRFHAMRGRGAAFFSLTLPEPGKPRLRTLTGKGVVELSSAADYYWLRGYLFVDDHPYYTRTDEQGNFTLEHVPAGDYELIAWMPNWIKAGHDRNPESFLISRLQYRPPVEQEQSITVLPGQETTASFAFQTAMFIAIKPPG